MIQLEVSFVAQCKECLAPFCSGPYYTSPYPSDEKEKKVKKRIEKIRQLCLSNIVWKKTACNRCHHPFAIKKSLSDEPTFQINLITGLKLITYIDLESVAKLHLALDAEDKERMADLVEKGVSINSLYEGVSPLYKACFKGNFEMAEFLLSLGANPKVRNDFSCFSDKDENWYARAGSNSTPLSGALHSDSKDIIELLLANFEKIDRKSVS